MKISILIPTYNRSGDLAENLSTILRYSSVADVSIYVSNNCSTDDTDAVMRDFLEKNSNIFYKRNETNVGFDANLVSLMHWAEGEYVWFLGDDDYICEGSIDQLLGILEREKVDAIVMNGAIRSRSDAVSLKLVTPKLTTRIYDDLNEVARDLLGHVSWMSSIIVRRELLDGFDSASLQGSQFMHLQAFFHAISKKDSFRLYCASDVFLTCPALGDVAISYYRLVLYTFLDRWNFNIERLPAGITAESREICFRQSLVKARTFIKLKSLGAYGVKDFIKYKRLIRRKGLLFPALVMLAMPRWVCRSIVWSADRLRG